jgi:hypothetical protein
MDLPFFGKSLAAAVVDPALAPHPVRAMRVAAAKAAAMRERVFMVLLL